MLLASLAMLVSSEPEPPTSYSSFSSQPSAGVSFQNVPSVANLQYSSQSSRGYSTPSSSYGQPSQQQSSYNAPSQSYGTSSSSSSSSGGFSTAASSYSAPSSQYGQPQQQQSGYHGQSQPANVQVSYGAPPQLPPGSSYGPPPVVTGAGPDHEIEYRVVYKPVKAPKPDIILPPPPPKQKTIVYILVPRIEAPDPIIVPTHPPTPPSKPEVYFIRYKAAPKKKPQQSSGNSLYGAPSQQYGVGSAPKPIVVEAPSPTQPTQRKREVVSVSSEVNEKIDDDETSGFGDRVKFERD